MNQLEKNYLLEQFDYAIDSLTQVDEFMDWLRQTRKEIDSS